MRLAELVEDLPVEGEVATDPEIRGVCHDSRRIQPGDLFVAWSGERHDGNRFAGQALDRGAAGVLASGPPVGEARQAPWLVTSNPRALLGPLAARVYGHPDRELLLIGVTGTNGKTTVVTLLSGMLEAAGLRCGTLGTLGYRFGRIEYPGERTTPEASDLFGTLRPTRWRKGACPERPSTSRSSPTCPVTTSTSTAASRTTLRPSDGCSSSSSHEAGRWSTWRMPVAGSWRRSWSHH
jgi:UDP-N-acetylmuramyl tripeptide synthase